MSYIGGLIGITVMSFGTNIVARYVGIITVFLLALWISATAPGSGGHINSTITFAVLLTRLILMSFSRGKWDLNTSNHFEPTSRNFFL
jgi:hypothetical protein